jgi:hypothetical protein
MEDRRRKTQCQWTPRVYHLINQAAALRLIKNAHMVQWMGRELQAVNLVYRVVSYLVVCIFLYWFMV